MWYIFRDLLQHRMICSINLTSLINHSFLYFLKFYIQWPFILVQWTNGQVKASKEFYLQQKTDITTDLYLCKERTWRKDCRPTILITYVKERTCRKYCSRNEENQFQTLNCYLNRSLLHVSQHKLEYFSRLLLPLCRQTNRQNNILGLQLQNES